jgi:hypothetical protein
MLQQNLYQGLKESNEEKNGANVSLHAWYTNL